MGPLLRLLVDSVLPVRGGAILTVTTKWVVTGKSHMNSETGTQTRVLY
jgi:hypothetical protein